MKKKCKCMNNQQINAINFKKVIYKSKINVKNQKRIYKSNKSKFKNIKKKQKLYQKNQDF